MLAYGVLPFVAGRSRYHAIVDLPDHPQGISAHRSRSALAGLFLLSTLAIGLLISTLAKTQYEAFQLSFLTLLPSVFLSGFIYPIAAMPAALQIVSRIIPLTYFLVVVRGIIIKEIGLPLLLSQVFTLAIFGVTLIALASLRFRKRLD